MTKILKISALIALSLSLSYCSDNDDELPTNNLDLTITSLEDLGADFVYEGWILVNGSPVSTGRFSVNDQGVLSQNSFAIDKDILALASSFILTIEPVSGDNPAPSKTHILAGDFSGTSGQLSIDHAAALGNNFQSVRGKYILATPTNGGETDEKSGVWFLDLSTGSPANGLDLPALPDGWKYEGWVISNGSPLTSGKFLTTSNVDEFNGFSSTMPGPPFPGEDYLLNAPNGFVFPLDLSGGKTVISIEPSPDNSPAPFLLKPLVGDIPSNAQDHFTYELGQNLNFPIGTFSR